MNEEPRGWRSRMTALRNTPGGIRAGLDPIQEASVRAEVRELSDADLEDEFEHARMGGMSTKRQWRSARLLRRILEAEYVRRGKPKPQQSVGPIRGRKVAGNMPTEGPFGRIENDDPSL
jgi:hypothetical protein